MTILTVRIVETQVGTARVVLPHQAAMSPWISSHGTKKLIRYDDTSPDIMCILWMPRTIHREWHGFMNPRGLRVRVGAGAGMGWHFVTPRKPAPAGTG
jgi:hypothetical protein